MAAFAASPGSATVHLIRRLYAAQPIVNVAPCFGVAQGGHEHFTLGCLRRAGDGGTGVTVCAPIRRCADDGGRVGRGQAEHMHTSFAIIENDAFDSSCLYSRPFLPDRPTTD